MTVTPDQLNAVVSTIQSRYPAFNYVSSYSLGVQGVIPANASPSQYTTATITTPEGGTNTPTVISSSQWYVIYDEVVTNTSDIQTNAKTKFIKNNGKVLEVTAPLLQNLSTNNTRPGLSKPMVFEPQSQLTLSQAPTKTATTVATTNTFDISVVILDSSYSNQLSL